MHSMQSEHPDVHDASDASYSKTIYLLMQKVGRQAETASSVKTYRLIG